MHQLAAARTQAETSQAIQAAAAAAAQVAQQADNEWRAQAEMAANAMAEEHKKALERACGEMKDVKELLDQERERTSDLQRQIRDLQQPIPTTSHVRATTRTQYFTVQTEDEASDGEEDGGDDQGNYDGYGGRRNHPYDDDPGDDDDDDDDFNDYPEDPDDGGRKDDQEENNGRKEDENKNGIKHKFLWFNN